MNSRDKRITSTRCHALLMKEPKSADDAIKWMTPLKLWSILTGRISDEKPDNEAMKWGRMIEPLLQMVAQEQFGGSLRPTEFIEHENGWSGDSADGELVHEDGTVSVIEAKTAGIIASRKFGEEPDAVPQHYLLQAHWHLIHRPYAKRCIMPVLMQTWAGATSRCYVIERDDAVYPAIMKACENWYRSYVDTNIEPPPEAADNGLYTSLFPIDNGLPIKAHQKLIDAATQLDTARKMIRHYQAQEEALSAQVKSMLGDYVISEWDTGRVTWKSSKERVITDWQAVAMALNPSEDLINKHTAARPGNRPLLVKIGERK